LDATTNVLDCVGLNVESLEREMLRDRNREVKLMSR